MNGRIGRKALKPALSANNGGKSMIRVSDIPSLWMLFCIPQYTFISERGVGWDGGLSPLSSHSFLKKHIGGIKNGFKKKEIY